MNRKLETTCAWYLHCQSENLSLNREDHPMQVLWSNLLISCFWLVYLFACDNHYCCISRSSGWMFVGFIWISIVNSRGNDYCTLWNCSQQGPGQDTCHRHVWNLFFPPIVSFLREVYCKGFRHINLAQEGQDVAVVRVFPSIIVHRIWLLFGKKSITEYVSPDTKIVRKARSYKGLKECH